ncbi:MAG: IclR family transcriptional regulator [Acidimicrobiales bacterium]
MESTKLDEVGGVMVTEGTRRTGSQAVERALQLLRCFEAGPQTRSLSELAQLTGLTPATAHRLLRALCRAELLAHDPLTERYSLGIALIPLGSRAADAVGVPAIRPVLDSLATVTGESVNLGVRDGSDVLVLLSVPSFQNLRFDQGAGARVPVHASAMGKVLLAFDADPDGAVQSIPKLTKLTQATITSRSVLSGVLGEVRDRGWAINDEERETSVRSVAMPVRTADGKAVAAVSVQGPSSRMTDSQIRDLLPSLQTAAKAVSIRLSALRSWGPDRPTAAATG